MRKYTVKHYPVKLVQQALRNLGLKPATSGDGTGHKIWEKDGKKCRPAIHQTGKDLSAVHVDILGSHLAHHQIIESKRDLFAELRRLNGSSKKV